LERRERDPAVVRDLRRACAAHAARSYGWDGSVDALEKTLADLASSRRTPDRALRCVASGAESPTPLLRYRGEEDRPCPAVGTAAGGGGRGGGGCPPGRAFAATTSPIPGPASRRRARRHRASVCSRG